MNDLGYWLLFLSATVVLSIVPGPVLLLMLSHALKNGHRAGIACCLGATLGAVTHVLGAAAGLSAILISSEFLFALVKYAGAGYMIYLAVQAFTSTGADVQVSANQATACPLKTSFKEGLWVSMLNPKTAIFFMAFLPQFLREGYGPVTFQLIYLGLLVLAITMVIEITYIMLASRFAAGIRQCSRKQLVFDRVTGTVFVVLAFKLVADTNLATTLA